MNTIGSIRRWFGIGNANGRAGRALLLEQFRILTSQIPILYCVTIVDTLSIAYILPSSTPWSLRFGLPGILLPVCAVRLVQWVKLRSKLPTPEEALGYLAFVRGGSTLVNGGFLIWTAILFQNVDAEPATLIALLVFLGSVGSAYCLASFPSAARLTVLLSGFPNALWLLLTGKTVLVCIGLNLCLLLFLLVRVMNMNYRDLVKLVTSREKIFAERERAKRAEIAAVREQVKANEIADRFDTALNNMSQGLCFFDGEQRLIVWNRRYTETYDLAPDSLRPGMHLREVVDLRYAVGTAPAMTKEAYHHWRDHVQGADRPSDTIVELANGRVVLIRHRPMPDGGWVATHEDITERHEAQRELSEAKANAERAEEAARVAHETLVAALDVVPEGLVILDAQDRYVLWNRRYLELYPESQDALVAGMRFEDTLRYGLARGQYPEASGREEEWLQERLARHAQPQSAHEQQLAGDRWIRVEERRIADGGSIGVRVDITDLKRREASFRLLFEENPLPMWVVDLDTREFLAVNAATCRHYGYSREQMLTMKVDQIRVPEEAEQLREEFARHKGLQTAQDTRRHVTAGGRIIEVAIEARPLRYQGREAAVAVAFDMTDRKRAEQRIRHLACHDALTDLPNRAALDEYMSGALERAIEEDRQFAVLCLDLDRFKQINDLFGHSMGDAVLCEVSRRLQTAAQGAFVARIGGDEFIAICEQGPMPSSAELLASRFQSTLEDEIHVGEHSFELGLSVGMAVYPRDGDDIRSLFANADAALYRAKHDGRGAIRFFTAAMDQQLRDRRTLERDLKSAIANGELSLEYQPQQHADGRIVGFEALARWHHPERGSISPAEFIPVAEESGLIVELGEWVLREACQEAASWHPSLQVAVNVSAIQFRRTALERIVQSVIVETRIAPNRLELEITEGVLIEDVGRAQQTLNELKALGVRLALDDFGTGYSSLSYLQSFPLDRIKIDRTFISNLGRTERSLAIVRAVIGLAHGLGVPVLAEGVETNSQMAVVMREGCDEVQGYLIGKPKPIQAYAAITTAGSSGNARVRYSG
ncbi:MAG TPA: EAL domain-containing protein [Bradyrhizobium sp.]|uniref:EAL domain-containing protein n=1 Tax=Bradyrhizobium sp. TaxID=376 RepID=UPI002D7EBD00|nr:EAL domain-containing protein [Bradyrhizobium sp.]HET7887178.1 EAL domain-containing protein [Bradyrhizobium sp.]